MQISSTRPAISAFYAAYSNRTNANISSPTSQDGIRKSDTGSVTISDAARQAALAETASAQAQRTQGVAKADAVEMYQVPAWYAYYGVEVANTLGVGADWHAEKDTKMLAASPADRKEFTALIDKHYQQLMDENGIKTTADHYNATILNQERSESLRKQMMEKIQHDPRLAELVVKMGKDNPPMFNRS